MVVRNPEEIYYPDSDGKPTAENTLQYQWIVTIKGGMEVVFRDDPNVFVAGDLLWYPVEGEPRICAAPDTMIALGRPKRHRPCYKQWEEGGQPPQVVFEVLSHSNTPEELARKQDFYETYGVDEYYIYDPQTGFLSGLLRQGEVFRRIPNIQEGWTSPRLKVHFKIEGTDLILTGPNGKRFLSYEEGAAEAERESERAKAEYQRAERESKRAETEKRRAELESQRAELESQRAKEENQRALAEHERAKQEKLRADTEKQRADDEHQRVEHMEKELQRLRNRLRSKGIDLDAENGSDRE
jgi:Uma2 family endonuclease